MVIDDIKNYEFHLENFKLLLKFLKERDVYMKMRLLLFGRKKRTPHELFMYLENTPLDAFPRPCFGRCYTSSDEVNLKWFYLLQFVPYTLEYWHNIQKAKIMTFQEIRKLNSQWKGVMLKKLR